MQLFAADAGKGGVELGEDPLRLRRAAVLQASAGGIIDKPVAVLPEKGSPRLLAGGIHWAFHVRESVRLLKESEPFACRLRTGLLAGAHQPDYLPVQPLHKAIVQGRGNSAKGLLRQHRQYAAVDLRLRQ